MWWERQGLEVRAGRLLIAGRDVEALAREHGTPLYVIDCERVREQAVALREALEGAGLRGIVRLALKAQRESALLRFLRERAPFVGLDVCSPGEVGWALEHGWEPSEISYTGTNLSERDLDVILQAGVHLNVDLLTQIDRVGRRAPGRAIGLRVNPRIGAGGVDTLYSGERPTKFGVFAEQLGDAFARARRHRLTIDTVHFHVGDGYLDHGLPLFEEAVRRVAEMTRYLISEGCPIVEINTGGGLGVPQRDGERPLDLTRWAAILSEHLEPFGVPVATEPGDFLAKDAVALLAEVVSMEERDGVRFVGLDTGWNVMCEHFVYDSPLDFVLCRNADGEPVHRVTVSGHINEGDDLFAEDFPLPETREGDILAALNVGTYNGSMTSEHCLRPPAKTLIFDGRT
ncbi:MAG TPA: diaminopimelate decarboxylase [Actinomycetota bacterium]|jgi:diaminopimelate decarboxylase|nr:diaminopimelate decarboxylase [Actinomycetota bacterium]